MDDTLRVTAVEPGWHDARVIAHGCVDVLPSEDVALAHAHDRVTARAVAALSPLPSATVSAMDGWAVAGSGPWRVVGDLRAGTVWRDVLPDGCAVQIATGAALPAGAVGVLRSEHGELDSRGELRGRVDAGQDCRPRGEEAATGEELLTAGSPLTPARIGLAAAAGHDVIAVVRRPRVRVLVLGDELLGSGPARDGMVRDSLGPQLPGWLSRMGVELVGIDRVEDSLAAHVHAMGLGLGADLVITTGGTAAGPVDHVKAALSRTDGRLLIDSVACRPGHPMLLGAWPTGQRLIGLPGNPLAAITALVTLGVPLVAGLVGRPLPVIGEVVLGDEVANRGAKTRLVPCRLSGGRAMPCDHIGSGMLRGLADADGFAVVGQGEGKRDSFAGWVELP